MDRQYYIDNVEDLSAQQIAEGILREIVTFDELRETGDFDHTKQKKVKELLSNQDGEKEEYEDAKGSINALETFIKNHPQSIYVDKAKNDIEALRKLDVDKRDEKIQKILDNPNKYTPDEIINSLDIQQLESLCGRLGISVSSVEKYEKPQLRFNDVKIDSSEDIPQGYTDIFFWGIPSSGKTCALAAVFSTINKDFVSQSDPKLHARFNDGSSYRTSLKNIFVNEDGIGYLPDATNSDRTQYMPFMLKRHDEKNYRKISCFELSGEVFRQFYELKNPGSIEGLGIGKWYNNDSGEFIANPMETLKNVLGSNNQKIHYFFIDYSQDMKSRKDEYGLTQEDYLEAATYYFNSNKDIFKRKTDAVFVVVTKSDEIKGSNKESEASIFLKNRFSNFIGVLKTLCKENNVYLGAKTFSIGNVYFKRICNINREYSKEIIDDIITLVQPESKSWIKKLLNI